MVPAISDPSNAKARPESPSRLPILSSEKDNGFLQRRPRGRQVSSWYMPPSPSVSTSSSATSSSSSCARRCPSPLLSRSISTTTLSTRLPSAASKRSQSVGRRRPANPGPMTPVPNSRNANGNANSSAAAKLLVTSSKCLSVSFQGEAFSLPISEGKAAAPILSNVWKATPERRRSTPVRRGDRGDNSKQFDQHRWPGRTRQLSSNSEPLSKSLNCSGDKKKIFPNVHRNVIRALQDSVLDESRRASIDGRLSLDLGNAELFKSSSECSLPSDLIASDTDSVSSGSTSGVQDYGRVAKGLRGPRGILLAPRFRQEKNSRLRPFQEPCSPLSTSPGSKIAPSTKLVQSEKFASDGPLISPRSMASPIRRSAWVASPSKLCTSSAASLSRRIPSPARVRSPVSSTINSNSVGTPSILSFSADIPRGKMREDRVIDAHTLRLLYNCNLQWRFTNARADVTFLMQKLNVERYLWNAWVTISELQRSITHKRIKLLLLRQKLKISSILKGQMPYLEEWAFLNRDHFSSLLGAIEALGASTVRLPVVGKATADMHNLKDAVGSAVDVMQAMALSICSISFKVDEINALVAELVKVTLKEQVLLEQCRAFLSSSAALQVKDCSLRTHIIQLNRVLTISFLTTHV